LEKPLSSHSGKIWETRKYEDGNRVEAVPVEVPHSVFPQISFFFLTPFSCLCCGTVVERISVFRLYAPNWLLALNCRQVPGKPICHRKE